MLKLQSDKQYKQIIGCLQSALVHGQGQPWMYEVLALSMEIEGFPKEDVERVVFSLTDFGEVDYASMIFSGAYLTRLGRNSAALTLYRQASRMLPERSEPYLLGLKLARETKQADDLEWAACGILQTAWGTDFADRHRDAENAMREQIRLSRQQGDLQTAQRLQNSLDQARSIDLMVRLEWNGSADLDLQVEEAQGGVCSIQTPETQGGGLFLHDGVGPDAKNSYELYVAPRAFPGPYRLTIQNAGGTLVGNRATLTVTQFTGQPEQSRFVKTISLEPGSTYSLTVDLLQGRRTQPHLVSEIRLDSPLPEQLSSPQPAHRPMSANNAAARQAFEESRTGSAQRAGLPQAGAFGYAPVIQVIPQGTALNAQAIVSPDRRSVRIGLQPQASEIVDVSTFSFLNGAGQTSAGNSGNPPVPVPVRPPVRPQNGR